MNFNNESDVIDNLPERVEGWLNVLDASASGDLSLIIEKSRHLQWRPLYCVLRISSHRLSHSRIEDRAIQKKSQSASILRIGGALDELLKSSENLNQSHRDDDLDSKERNLFSFGVGNSLEDNSTNRFISFINRTSSQIKGNLRRTRSSSKLDRRKMDESSIDAGSGSQMNFLKRTRSFGRLSKRLQNKWKGVQDRNESSEKEKSLRTAQSHESLVCHQPIINLTTLNSSTDIRVIHNPLILMKENCFLISTDKVSRFYSSSSSNQMYIWLKYLKQSLNKIRIKEFHNLKSLSILISEAKNLSNKLRYFCELTLDGQVYGRTTTKGKGEMLFWGEEFNFRNLPTMMDKGGKLTINIFQDVEKKKKKDLSILIGCVSLQLSELSSGYAQEKWFPVRLMSDKSNKEAVSIRIRVKYQSVDVLPFEFYSPLLNYMENNYSIIVGEFEQLLSAKQKEEFGILMVNIFRAIQKSEKFLVDIIMAEVIKQEKIQDLLRSNSIASKSIDSFMKLVSEKYLKNVLGNLISSLVDPNLNLEVDNIQNANELHKRQEKMLRMCNSACSHIFASRNDDDDETCFPKELKQVFTSLKTRLVLEGFNDNTINQIICSCFFLRFICPAIMSPSLFGLTRSLPQEKEARNCTLAAKAIQGLANFTRFGEGKEESMIFLNEFVESQTLNLKRFINNISDFNGDLKDAENIKVEIGLDLSHDLSLLHLFLKHVLEKKFPNEMKFSEIVKGLFPILNLLDESYNQERNTLKLDGSTDSINDLPMDEDGVAKRRTMREIHESGSYISFTSLQNISDQTSGNGFNVISEGQRLTSSSDIDKFSVSSSRAGIISDNNASSSCLDIKYMNLKTKDGRNVEYSLDSRKSDKQTFTTSLSPMSVVQLDANLQSTFREMQTNNSGPQRATLVYAAETEIDCCNDAITSWKALTPQGNLVDYPNGKFQIVFDLPKQDDILTHRSHFAVSSLKRQPKDQQRPLIFSNPGFGLKSSVSQNSLKIDVNSKMDTKNTLMLSECELATPNREVLTDRCSNAENKCVNLSSNLEFIDSKVNTIRHSQDSAFQTSKCMESTLLKYTQTVNNPNFGNDLKMNSSSDTRSSGDSSFSGRGDIGFNVKSGSQSLCKMTKKINGNKDTDGQILAQKSQVADLKWMLQQEREARSRMESEYERKLRISEQERKRMEIKAFEDKKLIDILQKQIKEEREKAVELEKRLSKRSPQLDSAQLLTKMDNKVSKKWPTSMSAKI